jgi:AcrR family transcriptional regulator
MADRPYHHGSLRQAMLEAAERILERDGIAGLTLRGAAREAGASHAAPKNHFGDLSGLLSELAAIGFVRFRDAMLAEAEGRIDPLERMRATGRGYVKFARANPGLFLLMFRSEKLDMNRPALRTAANEAIAVLAGTGAGLSTGGAPAELSLDQAARMAGAWAGVHGLAMLLIDGRLNAIVRRLPEGTTEDDLLARLLGGHGRWRSSAGSGSIGRRRWSAPTAAPASAAAATAAATSSSRPPAGAPSPKAIGSPGEASRRPAPPTRRSCRWRWPIRPAPLPPCRALPGPPRHCRAAGRPVPDGASSPASAKGAPRPDPNLRCGGVSCATLIHVMRLGWRVNAMPTYYFTLRGERFELPDLAGKSLPDDAAARAEAERLAAELVETALIAGTMPPDAVVEVDDEEMRPVLALPLNPAGG